jgi:hypothetical protein
VNLREKKPHEISERKKPREISENHEPIKKPDKLSKPARLNIFCGN